MNPGVRSCTTWIPSLRPRRTCTAFGGFVIGKLYGLTRVTADLDVISVRGARMARLQELADLDFDLNRRHRVYLDVVTVAIVPDHYEERLTDWLPDEFQHLRLKVLEKHDLALSKLSRNLDRDREDVTRLCSGVALDVRLLARRYRSELRYQTTRPERDDLTLDLWIEMINEIQGA